MIVIVGMVFLVVIFIVVVFVGVFFSMIVFVTVVTDCALIRGCSHIMSAKNGGRGGVGGPDRHSPPCLPKIKNWNNPPHPLSEIILYLRKKVT